ncbi:hypothetical protein FKW77_001256 [Venturia effusa]|uniref:Transcription initiation factor TFIID subunit 4 n=1 Tax=Venturia effusa TaxID=50376 RepID=A0A517LPL0_9PEZI|nr:hypothetical protein FKW77_001256 [Venturia effusa]
MASPPGPGPQRTHPIQTSGIALPPAKRQRLSPGPSPLSAPTNYGQASPTYTGSAPFANAPYASSPSAPGQYMTQPPYDNHLYSFNQPSPVQPPHQQQHMDGLSRNVTGAMGPPEKPKAEKATDINDLNDMVTASGIDLREEENYLAATYRNRHAETSFVSQSNSTLSANTSFNQWSQESYGNHPGFQSHGPLSQPAVSQKSLEEIQREKHRLEVHNYNARKQKHLNDPFLQTGCVRERLERKTLEYQVRLDSKGFYEQAPPKPPPQNPQNLHASTMTGVNGTGIIVAKASGMLEQGAPLVDLLSLLSLAANERLRGLLEDAHAISRARQFGSQGVVPPEWADIAEGRGKPQQTEARSQSIMRTAWDQVPDSAVSPKTVLPSTLDSTDPTRMPTPPQEPEQAPKPTIAFSSSLPTQLRSIADADKEAEKKRLERRKKRDKERQNSVISDTASPMTATAVGPGTPGMETAVKITKKQAAKESKQTVTDEAQRKQANQTAAMALGGMGKKYSWMTAAAPKPAGGLQAGVGLGRGAGTPGSSKSGNGSAPAQPQEDVGLRSRGYYKKLGSWREDGPTGRGIQIRDWITVLERDGIEKKSLAKSYARLSSGDKER